MLVCFAVFKTVAGGEELPRWVRFPHTLANQNHRKPDGFDFPDIPQIIAYMLKLTSISCFSIVMPIYIDNLMIIGYLITIRRGLCMKEINSFG